MFTRRLTGLFVFDPNRVAVAGTNQPREFDFFACDHVRSLVPQLRRAAFPADTTESTQQSADLSPGNI